MLNQHTNPPCETIQETTQTQRHFVPQITINQALSSKPASEPNCKGLEDNLMPYNVKQVLREAMTLGNPTPL